MTPRSLAAVAVCVVALAATAAPSAGAVVPAASLASAPYAPWAHAHWVWLDNDVSNQANVTTLVADYAAHNISVGAVDIDSGWSTGFNNFVVDTGKFPNMSALVEQLHAKDIKIILWATSMVDTDSSNYNTALSKDYFVKNLFDKFTPLKWWHGKGGLLDYTNPEAVEWWHSQLDNVLDIGIDGWKCDGTDPYIIEYVDPHAHSGAISYRDYADAYYGDFFNYTRQKNGDHCLIMSRPVDSYDLVGQLGAYLEFSPRYVVFSGWVGDEDPTWAGMSQALTNLIYSSWYNYTNAGCDIGGYRSGPGLLGRTVEVFTRWFQLGAFLPLMENGGGKEHRPWKFDPPGSTAVTDTYRKFVNAHLELGPYLLTTGTTSYEQGISSMRPLQAPPKHLSIIALPDITTPGYLLGDNYFINPILSNTTKVPVEFPKDPTSKWVNYFSPSEVHPGNTSAVLLVPLDTFPVFVRQSAILPLRVSTPDLHHGDANSADALTFAVYGPDASGRTVSQEVREFQGTGLVASYAATPTRGGPPGTFDVRFNVTAHPTEHVIVLLRGAAAGAATRVSMLSSIDTSSWVPVPQVAHPATGVVGWSHAAAADSNAGTADVFVRAGAAVEGVALVIEGVTLK